MGEPVYEGYPDMDQDGYGDANASLQTSCFLHFLSSDNQDCNDLDQNINIGAIEIWYDGVDQDCRGDDDYDQDGDRYVADEYASLSSYRRRLR